MLNFLLGPMNNTLPCFPVFSGQLHGGFHQMKCPLRKWWSLTNILLQFWAAYQTFFSNSVKNETKKTPVTNLKYYMKAQNEIEESHYSIASCWTCSCSQWVISRLSLWIPPPTHCFSTPSTRAKGRQQHRNTVDATAAGQKSYAPSGHSIIWFACWPCLNLPWN